MLPGFPRRGNRQTSEPILSSGHPSLALCKLFLTPWFNTTLLGPILETLAHVILPIVTPNLLHSRRRHLFFNLMLMIHLNFLLGSTFKYDCDTLALSTTLTA